MQNGSKSRVKKSPWPSRQGSIDGEKQSRALYNMYGPDDSRAPQKGTKLAGYRTTHLAVPTPCIHTYIPTVCRYCPSIHQYVCKHTCTIMDHGAPDVPRRTQGPVQPTLPLLVHTLRPTRQYRPPLFSLSDILYSSLPSTSHIPSPSPSPSRISYQGRLP